MTTPRIVLLLAVGALASSAALPAEQQVTIRAERPSAKVVGHTSSGVPISEYQLSYHVTFADLDVTTPVGVNALKARVRTAAYSLCRDLDKLYPVAEQDNACVQKAENSAVPQINAVAKVAQAPAKTKTK